MGSSFTWLDYSERDRHRALKVIDLFHEPETVDELGLATISSRFSDLFFPGITTGQTRACYLLLVPWVFRHLEHKQVPSGRAWERFRREELRINSQLLQESDSKGVFGRRAGSALRWLPSAAYWSGLGSWGIRLFAGHKGAYFRSLDGFYRRVRAYRNSPSDPEGRIPPPENWNPSLPDPPPGFPRKNVSIALRRQDAVYLRDQILEQHSGTLLGEVVRRTDAKALDWAWPWEFANDAGISPVLRDQLRNARLFAVCMQGTGLLYNLMLSEMKDDEEPEGYRAELKKWALDVNELDSELKAWEPEELWAIVMGQRRPLGYPTKAFVEDWVENLKREGPKAVASDNPRARDLVRDREVQLKRGRARLTNPRRLELWGGWSGTGRMNYRWGTTKVLLGDIFDGLRRSEGDAGHA